MLYLHADDPAFVLREGPYRREIKVVVGAGYAWAEMGDDVHHLAVRLEHHDGRIAEITGIVHRVPWTSCPSAVDALHHLVGRALTSPLTFADERSRHLACTHLLDLANICAARATGEALTRHYRCAVDLLPEGGTRGCLQEQEQQEQSLTWSIIGGMIISGDAFNGLAERALPRMVAHQPLTVREPALIMRRAMHIASCRALDLDRLSGPFGAGSVPASCFTYQSENSRMARRNIGTFVDFYQEHRWPLDA